MLIIKNNDIDNLQIGDVVQIDNEDYLVIQLPSCMNYIVGDTTMFGHDTYLHNLKGSGFYYYPLPLKLLRSKLHELDDVKVFSKEKYNLKLV